MSGLFDFVKTIGRKIFGDDEAEDCGRERRDLARGARRSARADACQGQQGQYIAPVNHGRLPSGILPAIACPGAGGPPAHPHPKALEAP